MYHKNMYPWVKKQDNGTKSENQTMYGLSRTSKSSGFSACLGIHFQVHFALQGPYLLSQTLQRKPAPETADGLWYVRQYTTATEQNLCFTYYNKLKKMLGPCGLQTISILTTQMHPKPVITVHCHIELDLQKGYCIINS